tara:strand:- start:161 stop:484 length:324 start_codon:yes stop_codon:yes gene_type:complete
MSHFAQINNDGIVQRVIVAEQDFINSGAVGDAFNWIQCSYNNNFRKQFPGIGYKWDHAHQVFVKPQPYASWTLDANMDWVPPVALPADADTVSYIWDEAAQLWVAPE